MAHDRFGRYEILGEIGDGSMSRVYKAWDPALERAVAVKTIRSELLTSDTVADYMLRFGREARAAGTLSHPAIVRIFDVGLDYIVMELIEGCTLKQALGERVRYEIRDALRLLGPVADAVDHAHRAGVIHRDIKPANVMVQPDGAPKLMDFGVARIESALITANGVILGSPSYMSPEQIATGEVSRGTDLYALAVVAYEMLTGRLPFQGTVRQVVYQLVRESFPPPCSVNASLPGHYDEVFARGLGRDPCRRFATAREFVAALEPAPLRAAAPERASADGVTQGRVPRSDAEDADALPAAFVASIRRRRAASRFRSQLLTAAALTGVVLAGASSTLVAARAPARSSPQPAIRSADVASHVAAMPRNLAQDRATSLRRTRKRAPAGRVVPRRRSNRSRRADVAAVTRPAAPAPLALTASTPEATPGSQALLAWPPGFLRQTHSAGPLGSFGQADWKPPRRISGQTVYPERRGREKVNGTVTISMLVDERGVPSELAVVDSAGPLLDAAALASVASWRFDPARRDGLPVSVRWLARQTYLLSR